MANRKQLKKSIAVVTGELFADCVALSMCADTDNAQLESLMQEIITLHDEYVNRLSHVEKGNERNFFKQLRKEFTDKANALSEQIVKA